jgi:filamentous hemagglutinin family protein
VALVGMLVAPPGAPLVLAAPEGENAVAGDVNFTTEGNVTLITASDGSIIEFDSFDIATFETVEFIQPSETARVLNRVLGLNPTQIDGSLFANGRIYLVNPAGIFFGGQAKIDVGGMIAAAGNLSNENFLDGVDRFTDVTGAVSNSGMIEAASHVALLGRNVANNGSILARRGMIAMVAGEEILLITLDGSILVQVDGPAEDPGTFALEQTGTLESTAGAILSTGDVYSLALNHDGITRGREIRIETGNGDVQIAGTLDASAIQDSDGNGGDIEIDAGGRGDVDVTGELTAAGVTSSNGGLGGDGGTVSITTENGSISVAGIDASGADGGDTAGDGGQITLLAQGTAGSGATFERDPDDPNAAPVPVDGRSIRFSETFRSRGTC